MSESKSTPYLVTCKCCGPVCLTRAQYLEQLRYADALWCCPDCGQDASWSDSWHETWHPGKPLPDKGPSYPYNCPDCRETLAGPADEARHADCIPF